VRGNFRHVLVGPQAKIATLLDSVDGGLETVVACPVPREKVEPTGLEPVTFALPARRSPS
jgi:hypothetical protein